MRVLLLAGLVASAYGLEVYQEWDAAYDADSTANKPDLPAGADAAQVAFDAVMTTQFPLFGAAMVAAGASGNYDAVKTIIGTLKTACEAWQTAATAWPTALTADQTAALSTAGAAALGVAWADYVGTCTTAATCHKTAAKATLVTGNNCAGSADDCTATTCTGACGDGTACTWTAAVVHTMTDANCIGCAGWSDTCTAGGGAWVASSTNVADAVAWWADATLDFGADWTAADGCTKAYGKDGSSWKQPAVAPMMTTAVQEAMWPAPGSAGDGSAGSASADDGASAASPAAALAAGIAGMALLL